MTDATFTEIVPQRERDDVDYAGDAYRACLYGHANRLQQMSVASQLILANGAKGVLLTALVSLKPILDRAESNASGNMEWDDVSRRVSAARAAIARATGERS